MAARTVRSGVIDRVMLDGRCPRRGGSHVGSSSEVCIVTGQTVGIRNAVVVSPVTFDAGGRRVRRRQRESGRGVIKGGSS